MTRTTVQDLNGASGSKFLARRSTMCCYCTIKHLEMSMRWDKDAQQMPSAALLLPI